MVDEIKKEDIATDDNTPEKGAQETKVETKVEAKVEAKVEESVEEQAKKLDNAVFAALRKRDLEGAKKLLEVDKPAEVDLSKYVEASKFDELLDKFSELNGKYDASQNAISIQQIKVDNNLSDADMELIMTDDTELLQKRAKALGGRNDTVARNSAVSVEIPNDSVFKGNEDLVNRMLGK